MNTDIAKLLEEYYAAWCAHDADRLLALFTEDCIYEDVPHHAAASSKQELRDRFLAPTFIEIPDFKVELVSFFAAGDWICHESVMTGTLNAAQPGSPAAGKSFSIRGASVTQIKDGKIAINRDYYDARSLH